MLNKTNKEEKIFGAFFGSILFILYLFYLIKYDENILFILVLSIFFFSLSLLAPSLLRYPNIYWIKFGYLLGKIISPIVLFFIYFFVILPINLIVVRIFKKDILSLKFSNNKKSYWIKKINSKTNIDVLVLGNFLILK